MRGWSVSPPGCRLVRCIDDTDGTLARAVEPAPALDLAKCPRPRTCPADAAYIFQPHSSDDDLVHSATVQNANYQRLGCLVYRADNKKYLFYPPPAGYALDETFVN